MSVIYDLGMEPIDLVGWNLNLLVALDALLDTCNVRLAANRLGVTQSAMSHTLRQLREELSDPVLIRSGNQMLPTPRAERMRAPLRRALLDVQALLRDEGGFDPASARRVFTIAASDALAVTVMPDLVRVVAEAAPHVTLELVALEHEGVAAHMAEGVVDLCVSPGLPQAPGLRRRALQASEFAVVVRADHPEVGERLDIDTYCRLPHALVMVTGRGAGVVDEVLHRRGRSRHVALRIPYFLAAPAIIAATNLVLTIPRAPAQAFAARWPLRVLPPPIPLPSGTVHIWWHERFDNDPAHQWLRAQVVAAARADG